MALLEEMMKNMPSLSGEAKEELRKSFRHKTRRKSTRRVGLYYSDLHALCECTFMTILIALKYILALGTKSIKRRNVHDTEYEAHEYHLYQTLKEMRRLSALPYFQSIN